MSPKTESLGVASWSNMMICILLSHLPKRAKKSNFPAPATTTNYRLPKTEVKRSEKKERGLEGEYT
jgi:hypothetical protein